MKKKLKALGLFVCILLLSFNVIYANSPTVVLDAGHGGADSGAISQNNDYLEKVWNLQTTKSCKETLEKYGVNVIMTRESDIFLSLAKRKEIVNNSNTDVSISIHYNASQGRNGSYGLVIGGKTSGSTELATSIKNELLKIRDNVDIWENGRYAMTNLKVPCVIVESAFIDSADSKYADTLEERQEIGKHIAYGILNYLDIDVKNETKEVVATKENKTNNGDNNNLSRIKEKITSKNNKNSIADRVKKIMLNNKKTSNNKIEYVRNLLGK